MGLLLALAYRGFGLSGVAIFLIPPIMMRYVAKQYVDRTLKNVRQLRSLNEKLEGEIAQRVAAEAEIAQLASEAARAHALEELNRLKTEFISIASHELRTPMTTILGFSELLQNQMAEEDPNRLFISYIHEDAQQLSDLVNNLLDISRIESGRLSLEPETIDLVATLDPLLQSLGTPAPLHRLYAEIAPEARWVYADPSKVIQILTNLIGNAIKYSPKGGRVQISSRLDYTPGWVTIEVTDQGIGIPADQLERIFERFQRVQSAETGGIRGTGLGLYIVRQLVEIHGGSIRVESEMGRGSLFACTLPLGTAPTFDRFDTNGSHPVTPITVATA
jgi:signal transduction histidine kinase